MGNTITGYVRLSDEGRSGPRRDHSGLTSTDLDGFAVPRPSHRPTGRNPGAGVRENVTRVFDSLKPGGLVVVEGFHHDATRSGPIGAGVVFETNELPQLFSRFRVLRYEDTDATADFGLQRTRVVRLCAQKPER